MKNVEFFWQTLGTTLQRNAPEHFGPLKSLQIKSEDDFLNTFHGTQWKSLDTIILFDEFDILYNAKEDILILCLTTLHGIKASKQNYAIRSVIAIGPFSIMYLNSNNLTMSPFNVNELFWNPNFFLEQVQFIYKEFTDEYKLTIDQEDVEDIYIQTNGHAGLICLCGQYPTFIRMKDTLLRDDTDIKQAVRLLWTDFLANFDPVNVGMQNNLVQFLTAEGQIVSKVFPTSPKVEVLYHPSTGTLDILKALKQVVCIFDREIMKSCNSFKTAHVLVNNVDKLEVPRESVYDAELYRIMSNWLVGFTITGQWHLKYCISGHINHKYVDIVISRSNKTIALELLATATKKELKEHYEQVLIYDKKLPADETWIVHFTCEENTISELCWPTKSQLQKGLQVVYFWHDLNFIKISMIACWWNMNNNMKHVTDVEEIMDSSLVTKIVQGLLQGFLVNSIEDNIEFINSEPSDSPPGAVELTHLLYQACVTVSKTVNTVHDQTKTEVSTQTKVNVLTKSQVSESEEIECRASEIKVDTSPESRQTVPFQYQNVIDTLYALAKSQLEEKVLSETQVSTQAKVNVLTKSQVSKSEGIECGVSEIKVDTLPESRQTVPFQYQNVIDTLYTPAKSQLEEKVLSETQVNPLSTLQIGTTPISISKPIHDRASFHREKIIFQRNTQNPFQKNTNLITQYEIYLQVLLLYWGLQLDDLGLDDTGLDGVELGGAGLDSARLDGVELGGAGLDGAGLDGVRLLELL
ncbi:20067_t:CDS:2, partial [Dentiscutata erythropus]